jgi:N-acetyl-gamma-glutamyl-phosphate reductase
VVNTAPVPRIGIVGASGYTGAELLRLCAQHPALEVVLATGDTQAGTPVGALYPSLRAAYPDLVFSPFDPDEFAGLDLVFLGLPHGASQTVVPQLAGKVDHLVDLAADFRLRDPTLYPRWYGETHAQPQLIEQFAYGLPELFRDDVVGSAHVAAPGCYPTSAALALAPLVRAGAIETTGAGGGAGRGGGGGGG